MIDDYTALSDADLVRRLSVVSSVAYISGYSSERRQVHEISDELLSRLKELRRLEDVMREQRSAAIGEYIR